MPGRGSRKLGVFAALAMALLIPASPVFTQTPAGDSTSVPVHWSMGAARELITLIEESHDEGLAPADYGLAELRRAAMDGESGRLDMLASASALSVAHDYACGGLSDRSGMQWLSERAPYDAAQFPARLRSAMGDGKLRAFFQALLPSDPRYAALRARLAQTKAGPERDRLRVNMESWRWMPRTIAANYLYVNVPSYKLRVVEDGVQLSSYDIVVGARDTPTPQMVSPTGSFVVNPAWYVPASIARKSGLRAGRGGFVARRLADGSVTVMQPPGPRNALGRIKFNLDNDQAIYLHDTNVKSVFAREKRALSHGCIRVKDIDQLASELMGQGGDGAALEEALASNQTATLHLPQTWPVYIVYFTADTDENGDPATYSDPYGYDARVLAALDGKPLEIASS